MADDSGIDPRYAAQFQRGFDPEVHAPPPTPPRPDGPVRLPGGPAAVAERVPPPPRAVPAAPAPPVVADTEPDEDVEADRRATWRERLLEWSLPGVGLVLLLIAISLFGELIADSQLFYGYTDPEQYAWAQVRAALPGPLVVAAVLCLTVWFVLRALRPKVAAT